MLLALPAPVPAREAMVNAHLAYAKADLPRARKRARQIGVDWPEWFEAVTWDRLEQALGIKRPYPVEV